MQRLLQSRTIDQGKSPEIPVRSPRIAQRNPVRASTASTRRALWLSIQGIVFHHPACQTPFGHMDSSTIISLEVVGVKYQSRFVTHGYLSQPNQPVRDLSNFPKTASSSEFVCGLCGRHLPKCMQECDFRHVVRLKSRVFFRRQVRLAMHPVHTAC